MAKFERRAVLQSIQNPNLEAAQATERLRESFSKARDFGLITREYQRVEEAKAAAAEQEYVPGAPLGNLSPSTSYGRAFNQANEAGYIAATKNAYMDKLDQLSRQYADNPDGFTKTADAYRKSMIQNLPAEVRTQVSYDFDQTVNSNLFSIRDTAAKNAIAQTSFELAKVGDTMLGELAKAARKGDQKYLAHNAEQYNLSVVAPLKALGQTKEANAALSAYQTTVIENTYLGEYERAEAAGTGADYIMKFMDNPPKDMTLDEADELTKKMTALNKRRRTLESAKQADMTTEQELDVSKSLVDIARGKLTGETAIKTLDDYLKKNWITREKHTSSLIALGKVEDEITKKNQKFAQISRNVGSGNGAFVEQKDADEYYEEHYTPKVQVLPPEDRMTADINLVRNLKKVPKGMKTQLNALVMSDNPDNIALAAQYADGFDDVPGLLDSTFDKNTQAMIATMVDLSPNMKPNEAVQLARKITDPRDKARIDAITEELKERKLETYQSEVISELEDKFMGLFGGADVMSFNKDQMTSEYKSVYDAFRKEGLSHDKSKEKAAKTLKRNWKEFNGYVMRNSPVDFYSVNGETDYIMKQLVKDVATETIGATPVPKENLFLVSDERTSREASTGKPTYRVFYRDESGSIIPMMGFRWSPDIEKEKNRILEANKRKLDRTEREKRVDEVLGNESLMNIK